MKKKTLLTLFVIVPCLALWGAPALAVPYLQLDIAGGTYDMTTETIVASSDPFYLYALQTPNDHTDMDEGTFYISIAIIPQVGPDPISGLGSITFAGNTIDVTDDMVYGTPPIETIATQMSDPGDLPPHGIFETYFTEVAFQFDEDDTMPTYNTQDRAVSGGDIPAPGDGDTYYAMFEVSTDLPDGYVVHFDLYNTFVWEVARGINPEGDVDVDDFCPFSHDAQSNGIPDAGAVFLLGSACLVGFAGLRRKYVK